MTFSCISCSRNIKCTFRVNVDEVLEFMHDLVFYFTTLRTTLRHRTNKYSIKYNYRLSNINMPLLKCQIESDLFNADKKKMQHNRNDK